MKTVLSEEIHASPLWKEPDVFAFRAYENKKLGIRPFNDKVAVVGTV